MPRTLKKHWPLILLVTFAVVASGSIWWLHGSAATAADPPATAEAPATTSPAADEPAFRPGTPWVPPVVKRLGLTADQMVALNLNADQARTVRTIVRDWCDSNKTGLASTFSQPGAAREAQLTTALADLENRVAAVLTGSQAAAWRSLRQYQDLPIAYRLAAPNDEQRAQVKKLLQARWYSLQAAKSPSEQQQVRSKFEEKLASVLDGSQLAMISTYRGYRVAAATAIAEPVLTVDGTATTTDWQ